MSGKEHVLLADANEEYRLLMRDLIESTGEFRLVADTGSGAEALELALRLQPDVVITDAVLPGLDGFELLGRLEGVVPGLVMITGFCTRAVMLQAIHQGIRHFLPKPFETEALLETLRRACGAGVERAAPARWELLVTRALQNIGMPAHLKGYPYVRRAILMVMEEPHLAHALTKELYPALARQFATTPGCVERAIRSAVEAAWLRGDPEIQRKLFKAELRWSNGTFIATMAEKLCFRVRDPGA